jgi:hypothetical protein
MTYTNEELTQRVKQLEKLVLDLSYPGYKPPSLWPTSICANTSLHGKPGLAVTHPSSLLVPHYAFEPQVAWRYDIIHLHPGNKGE